MVFFSPWRVTEWQVIRVYYYQLGVSSDPSAHLRWALHSSHSCVHWQAPICNRMVFKFLLFHLMIWKRNSMSKQMLTKEDAGRRMWRDTWVILMNLTKNPPLELHDAEHQRMRSGGVLQQRLSLRCRVIQITSKHTFKKKTSIRLWQCDLRKYNFNRLWCCTTCILLFLSRNHVHLCMWDEVVETHLPLSKRISHKKQQLSVTLQERNPLTLYVIKGSQQNTNRMKNWGMYQRCRFPKILRGNISIGKCLGSKPASIPTQASLDKEIRVFVKNPARNWILHIAWSWMNFRDLDALSSGSFFY